MKNSNFITLEDAVVRDWLNLQIRLRNRQQASCRLNRFVSLFCPDNDIQLDEGVVYIANLLGLELEERSRMDRNYLWEYSFTYEGTRFYQLSKERQGKYAGT